MNSTELIRRAGITYRQLDYWKRMGYLRAASPGSGVQVEWDRREILVAVRMGCLVEAGLSVDKAAEVARRGSYRHVLRALTIKPKIRSSRVRVH